MTRTVDGLDLIQRLGQQYEEALKAAGLPAGHRDDRRDGAHADRRRRPVREAHARELRTGAHARHRA